MLKNRVRELRNEKGLRQEDLAEKINVSQQTISRIENGENDLPSDILIQLSKYFHVSADYILNLSDERLTRESSSKMNQMMVSHMDFFQTFCRLDKTNQDLISSVTTQIEKGQNKNNN